MKTYYEILQCKPSDSSELIKNNHQKLLLKNHPDKNPQISSNSFLQIQKAWNVLRNPDSRNKYDSYLSKKSGQKSRIDPFDHVTLENVQIDRMQNLLVYNCPSCNGTNEIQINDFEILVDSDELIQYKLNCEYCSHHILLEI